MLWKVMVRTGYDHKTHSYTWEAVGQVGSPQVWPSKEEAEYFIRTRYVAESSDTVADNVRVEEAS